MARLRAGGWLPLLPAQRAVQARLDTQQAALSAALDHDDALDRIAPRRAKGTYVEPLHHHAWPRSGACTHRVRRLMP